MTIDDLEFPILTFNQGIVLIEQSADAFTLCERGVIKRWYCGLLIVDSYGRAARVTDVRVLHPVGPLWGYNIWLRQKVRVELVLTEESPAMPLEDVKRRVTSALKRSLGSVDPDYATQIRRELDDAPGVPEIIDLLINKLGRLARHF